jgi:uncharacterized protein YecT (DUF1311 family)
MRPRLPWLPVFLVAATLSFGTAAQEPKALLESADKTDAAIDRTLNAAYQDLIRQIQKDEPDRATIIVDKLREAQRAWIKYREAQIEFVGLYNDIGSASARRAGLGSYNVEITESRIADLKTVPNPF